MIRIAFIFLCLLAGPAAAQSPATPVVERLHEALLGAMKGGAELGFRGRRDLINPVVREVYDMEAMARVATGAAWQRLTPEERGRVVDAFAAWTVATYANQFRAYEGEQFQTKGETEAARGRRAVDTALIAKGEPPVALNYQLRQSGGAWRIVDVLLDGSVSQLAMRRNEFAAVLSRGGVDALIKQMETQTAQLARDR
jgi:phospholipid transport system substrate-binding protein